MVEISYTSLQAAPLMGWSINQLNAAVAAWDIARPLRDAKGRYAWTQADMDRYQAFKSIRGWKARMEAARLPEFQRSGPNIGKHQAVPHEIVNAGVRGMAAVRRAGLGRLRGMARDQAMVHGILAYAWPFLRAQLALELSQTKEGPAGPSIDNDAPGAP